MKTLVIFMIFLGISMGTFANENATLNPLDREKAVLNFNSNVLESPVTIKLKDDLNRTIQVFNLTNKEYKQIVFNFKNLNYGTYFMDIFQSGNILRKTLDVKYDGIHVSSVMNLKKEFKPYSQWSWHPYHE